MYVGSLVFEHELNEFILLTLKIYDYWKISRK